MSMMMSRMMKSLLFLGFYSRDTEKALLLPQRTGDQDNEALLLNRNSRKVCSDDTDMMIVVAAAHDDVIYVFRQTSC